MVTESKFKHTLEEYRGLKKRTTVTKDIQKIAKQRQIFSVGSKKKKKNTTHFYETNIIHQKKIDTLKKSKLIVKLNVSGALWVFSFK